MCPASGSVVVVVVVVVVVLLPRRNRLRNRAIIKYIDIIKHRTCKKNVVDSSSRSTGCESIKVACASGDVVNVSVGSDCMMVVVVVGEGVDDDDDDVNAFGLRTVNGISGSM